MLLTLDRDVYYGNPVPVRYDLVFQMEGIQPMFVFSAPEALVRIISPDAPKIQTLKQNFAELGEFAKSDDNLGFGAIFSKCEPLLPIDGYLTWKAAVPPEIIVRDTTDWAPALQLAATLDVLTSAARVAGAQLNSKNLQQLVMYYLLCHPDMNGFRLNVTISPNVRHWIEEHRTHVEPIARDAMIAVYRHMWPDYFREDEESCLHSFRVWDNGNGDGLAMDVPGQTCGLFVDGMDIVKGPGWHLDSHNVDSPIKQLSLIAGLAAITRQVRESQLAVL